MLFVLGPTKKVFNTLTGKIIKGSMMPNAAPSPFVKGHLVPETLTSILSLAPRLIGVLTFFAAPIFAVAVGGATTTPVLLHAFVANGTLVGYLYGYRETDTLDAYSKLEIRSDTSTKFRLLYRIERTGLYLANGKLDAAIHDDGSRGFFLSVQRPHYVTIECCRIRTPNNGAGDPLNIEWNSDTKRFEMLKTP